MAIAGSDPGVLDSMPGTAVSRPALTHIKGRGCWSTNELLRLSRIDVQSGRSIRVLHIDEETHHGRSKQETGSTGGNQEVQKAAPTRALRPFEEMDRLFDQFLRRNWMRPWHLDWPALPELSLPELKAPKVDVLDREGEIVVKAEIPGVDKKDIDISVGEDSVSIKGETRKEEKEEKGDYYRCEISSGSFSRSIPLPTAVDGTKATASFKDGVLELTLPKLKATRRHKISVK